MQLSILLCTLTIGGVYSIQYDCPPGWSLFEASCYMFGENMPWDLAEKVCVADGAHLASIHSEAENTFIINNLVTGRYITIGNLTWFGAKRSAPGKNEWIYTDGTKVINDNYRFRNSKSEFKAGFWNDAECSLSMRFVCKKAAVEKKLADAIKLGAVLVSLNCPEGWIEFAKNCYYFGNNSNWDEAEAKCVAEKAHLASVHGDTENAFIISQTTMGGVIQVGNLTWIGVRRDAPGSSKWVNVDKTEVDFSPWHPGQPDNMDKSEACVHVINDDYRFHTNNKAGFSSGFWNDANCKIKMQYVCKKPIISP